MGLTRLRTPAPPAEGTTSVEATPTGVTLTLDVAGKGVATHLDAAGALDLAASLVVGVLPSENDAARGPAVVFKAFHQRLMERVKELQLIATDEGTIQ